MSVGGASSPHNPSDFLDQRLPTPIADFEKDKQPDEIAFAYGKMVAFSTLQTTKIFILFLSVHRVYDSRSQTTVIIFKLNFR